jgi:hypothetical protein
MVSTREGGIAAQCTPVNTIMPISNAMIRPTTIVQRFSAATAMWCGS